MIDLNAIRSEARRQIAVEGRVGALGLIEGLDRAEQFQALGAIREVLSEHLRRMKSSVDLGRDVPPSSTVAKC